MFELKNILVPTDCSELSKDALRIGISFAKKHDAKLVLLYVTSDTPFVGYDNISYLPVEIAQQLQIRLEQGHEKEIGDFWNALYDPDVKVDLLINQGDPFTEIIKFARSNEVDLIIMGTNGRTGIKHILMGSVTEKVVRYSPLPVLTVKHAGQNYDPIES